VIFLRFILQLLLVSRDFLLLRLDRAINKKIRVYQTIKTAEAYNLPPAFAFYNCHDFVLYFSIDV